MYSFVFLCADSVYFIATADMGLGLSLCRKPQTNGSPVDEGSSGEEDLDDEEGVNGAAQGEEVVRAVYAFSGSNEDEVMISWSR